MYLAEATHFSKTNKYPVFIILQHMHHNIANTVVKVFTGDKWTHSSISFNHTLKPYFSFGKKNMKTIGNGFVIGDPKNDYHKHYPTTYQVYVLYVSKQQYMKMVKRVQWFVDNKEQLTYDYIALLYNLAQIPQDERDGWFCSRFVADILKSGDIELPKNNSPSLFDPQDLLLLNNITLLDEGDDFSKYNPNKVRKILNKMELDSVPKITDDTWFTSDTHVGKGYHNEKDMIRQINKKVQPSDTLFFLGDIGYKKDPELKKHTQDFLSSLMCKNIYLVAGNHDLLSKEEYLDMGFGGVWSQIITPKYIFTHKPINTKDGKLNIHGHIHGNGPYFSVDPATHIDVYYGLHGGPIQLKNLLNYYHSGNNNADHVNDYYKFIANKRADKRDGDKNTSELLKSSKDSIGRFPKLLLKEYANEYFLEEEINNMLHLYD